MELTNFSLLFPDEKTHARFYDGSERADIDMYTLSELGMLEMLDLKSSELSEYFTTSKEVMEYRNEVFADMLRYEQLPATLSKLIAILNDITELRQLESEGSEADDYLASITEIELYVSCIEILHKGLPSDIKFRSRAFVMLQKYIRELTESEYYVKLNQRLNELTTRVREIKSISIGVNLDQSLRPTYAGVMSINSEPFKSGDTLDKILRLNFRNDRYTCIANLVPFAKGQSDNQKTALSNALNSAINDVYRTSLKSWKKIVNTYILENTDFLLKLLPEIEFLVKGTEMLSRIASTGCTLTKPEIAPMDERVFIAEGLYNPAVALKLKAGEQMVTNDVSFSKDDALIYVLTGPNRGGKSVITVAVGAAQAMFQLGLPVPATEAVLSPVDGIFTHFPEGADDTIDKGRLGEECARLREIFDSVSADSMVLLDESLSSTGAYEASYIASEILTGFAVIGARGIFSTHLHELAAAVPEINAKSAERGGVSVDTLVAGMEEGERSFKITRAKPDGKSYARDIADKYGLSFDSLIKRHEGGADE